MNFFKEFLDGFDTELRTQFCPSWPLFSRQKKGGPFFWRSLRRSVWCRLPFRFFGLFSDVFCLGLFGLNSHSATCGATLWQSRERESWPIGQLGVKRRKGGNHGESERPRRRKIWKNWRGIPRKRL